MGTADWRIRNQAACLQPVRLIFSVWTPQKLAGDHDHCEFCFVKFADEALMPDALHTGDSTLDRRHWVCPTCFADFREQFEWCSE